MRRIWLPALCAGLLLTGCSGLPAAREMGDMALLRTMGVDAAPAGVELTVSTGPRARGLQGEGTPALTLSAGGESLSAACLALQGRSDSYVFFGYVDQLLLGEELVRSGVLPVLDYFARDTELGLGAQLWLVRGDTARAAVESGGEQGVEGRLSTLRTDGKLGAAAITRTAGELCTDLLELGCAYAPALSLEGENPVLGERGYGVLDESGLLGYLDGAAARGLELLAGRVPAQVLTAGEGAGQISARPLGVSLEPELILQAGEITGLDLDCRVEMGLTEYRQAPSPEALEALQEELARRLLVQMEAALEQLQAWRADCAGLGARAGLSCPGAWRRAEGTWADRFAGLEVRVDLRVTIHQ